MNQEAENNFGTQLIGKMGVSFDEKYMNLYEERWCLIEKIENGEKSLIYFKEEINKAQNLIQEKEALFANIQFKIQKIILDKGVDTSSSEEFQLLRKKLIEIDADKDKLNDMMNELIEDEVKAKERLIKNKESLEILNISIPINPYQKVLEILEQDEKRRKEFHQTAIALEVLKEIDINIAFDVKLDESENDFEIFDLVMNEKSIFVAKTILRNEMDTFRGDIVKDDNVMTPTLNFEDVKEVREVFKNISKHEIFIETVISAGDKKEIKNIFIKNPLAENEKQDYVKIGTKNLVIVEDMIDAYFNGLVIEFSEFPNSL